jgi:hypothetical protein
MGRSALSSKGDGRPRADCAFSGKRRPRPAARLALIIALFASGAAAAVLDRLAVTVGKDVITESEVQEEIRITALLNSTALDFSAAARREAANRLVDQTLIRQEMEVGGYTQPTDAEVDEMLSSLKATRFHGSDAEYRAALVRYGVTEKELRAHLGWQLSAIRFTDLRFQSLPATPPPASTPGGPPSRANRSMRANRAERAQPLTIDERLDAWLKDARSRTRVTFSPEAFQ